MLAQRRVAGGDRVYCEGAKRYYTLSLYKKKILIDERVVNEQEAIEKINQQLPSVVPNKVKSLVELVVPSTSKKRKK